MDSLQASSLTGAQKDELMEQVKQEIAVANFQELLTVSGCIISMLVSREKQSEKSPLLGNVLL